MDSTTAPLPDAWRVEVFRRPPVDDPEANHLLGAVKELGIEGLSSARVGHGYLLPPALSPEEAGRIATELLADPVLDEITLYAPRQEPKKNSSARRVLVAKKAGVMDPVAMTITRALERNDLGGDQREPYVSTFTAYELEGDASNNDIAEIARKILGNETIEDVLLDSESLPYGPPAEGPVHGRVEVPILEASDEALMKLSTDGCLSLNLIEMLEIKAHYKEAGREPSACELETIAQTWSEHCKHKTFAGIIEMDGERIDNLLKTTIKRATEELDKPWCISVFHDNAGIIEFDPESGWDLCFKVETHNHPSAIDPYGGAGTGIGGVIRDILGVGLGARPIANTDSFFVGPLDMPREDVPKGSMHPRRILRGIVAGVRDYGNRMGIPTVSGGVWVDPRYVGNPLVYAGTVGLIPRSCADKEVHPGDIIFVAGGRTGRDGIHGATFSSAELTEDSDVVSSAAVQIGDAITEKRVLDALLRARDLGLYRAVTDCGAGGFSSAVGEMGEKCGADVTLDSVPLKYAGLSPEEVWISEAQERMVFAVPPENLEACRAVFEAEGCETADIGTFTDTGRLILRWHEEVVADMSMSFLHDGTPRPTRKAEWNPPSIKDPGLERLSDAGDANDALVRCLAHPDVASKEWIVRQYDHEVQGTSVIKPFVGTRADGPSDAAVLRPLDSTDAGCAISCGANPRYGVLDPYRMALAVIDEALRNSVAVGGDPDHTAILDNFSWGNCDKPDRLGSLVLASKACYDAAMAYSTPFISGKDSLNNEYRVGDETISIPPTLLISALAKVQDVKRAMTMDLKQAGNSIYLVGNTSAELGGSVLFDVNGTAGGTVPAPDLALAPKLMRALASAIAGGRLRACHDLSEGGLAVAAAESAFSGDLGAELDLSSLSADFDDGYDRDATLLFSESCTRWIVEVAPSEEDSFRSCLEGLPVQHIGRVTESPKLVIRGAERATLLDISIDDLRAAHQSGFQG
ncbi:MAG: phosphoribosylformylglycinamidine synthase subunit PurL [Planctomycetota bacterium]|nr:phosphoribosylformylglycinamidine synthase subunit PurL [Planctomycetota bacterium]